MPLTASAAATIAADLRAATPLVQLRQVGRIVQELLDPDVAQVSHALARQAAQEVALPDGHMAAAAIPAGPGWWAAVLVAEAVNDGAPWLGTLMALLDQPGGVVATVMVRLLHPAGLVNAVRL